MKNINCLKLDEAKSWKNTIQEKLRDISELSDLEEFLNDERLQTFLNTKFKDLIKVSNDLGFSYRYFLSEDLWNLDMTLKEYIMAYHNNIDRLFHNKKMKILVSEDKTINGLILYDITISHLGSGRKDISEIGVISFDLEKNNITLIKDTYNLLVEVVH